MDMVTGTFVCDRGSCAVFGKCDPESKITIMTLIKQSGCVVTLAAGKWIYHEKHVLHRALCTVLVVAGIVVAVL